MKLCIIKLMSLALLTISIGLSQSYTPLWAPLSSMSGYVYCLDVNGNLLPYCAMHVSTQYYPSTNGHFHNSPTAPLSTVSPSSVTSGANGYAGVTTTTTIVGHAEYILVCPDSNPVNGCRRSDYAVGYTLYWVYHPEVWIQNGGNTTQHGDTTYNHWMTTNSAYGIYYASQDYESMYGGTLYSNDMGLPFGGKFDIYDDWAALSSHVSHDEGTAADINGVPSGNTSAFEAFCTARGAVDARTEGNGSDTVDGTTSLCVFHKFITY